MMIIFSEKTERLEDGETSTQKEILFHGDFKHILPW